MPIAAKPISYFVKTTSSAQSSPPMTAPTRPAAIPSGRFRFASIRASRAWVGFRGAACMSTKSGIRRRGAFSCREGTWIPLRDGELGSLCSVLGTVRTRVAPSPTGDPHVGTAYVALINYAFALQHEGTFVLRIEDTDRARSTPASERAILDALKWLGVGWAEGPDVGGPFGPYRQSERLDTYATYARQLLASGHAFYCFCTPERLDDMRAEQRAAGRPAAYDGRCLRLSQADVEAALAAGTPHVVRMTVPSDREDRDRRSAARTGRNRPRRRSTCKFLSKVGRLADVPPRERRRRSPDGNHSRPARRRVDSFGTEASAAVSKPSGGRCRSSAIFRCCATPTAANSANARIRRRSCSTNAWAILPEALTNFLGLLTRVESRKAKR